MVLRPPRTCSGNSNDRSHVKHAQQELSIRLTITLVAMALVLVSGGLVLTFVYRTSSEITKGLIREKAEIVNNSIVEQVRSHLLPVEAQAAFAALILAERDLEEAGVEETGALLFAALAASPQVSSLALVDQDFRLVRAFRNRRPVTHRVSDWHDDPTFVAMMVRAQLEAAPHWGPLFYAEASDTSFLNYLTPIEDARGRPYMLISSVSLSSLSRFLAGLESAISGIPFILYDEDTVLAHGDMREGYAGLSDSQPLPALLDFADGVLAQIWSPDRLTELEHDLANDLEARVITLDDQVYVFLFQREAAFGAGPWIIGSYVPLETVADALTRNQGMIALGALVVLAAIILALLLSRMLSRPLRQLATTADCINDWNLEACSTPRRSLFREINEANLALSSAVKGLHSLQVYLPHGLAEKLVQRHDGEELQPEERLLTVLFTDIVGFTAMAEPMAPKDVLALLNDHFSLLARCIRAEGGNVDKFIGDAAMAFWGGIAQDPDHAIHACRAAVRIAEAIAEDNRQRRAKGLAPIGLCIGVHSGLAMVGDIGPTGRVNYTVIGDTVNTAQRLEALGRQARREGEDVVCLISGQTALRLDRTQFKVTPLGRKVLHGRQDETEVFRLEGREGTTPDLR